MYHHSSSSAFTRVCANVLTACWVARGYSRVRLVIAETVDSETRVRPRS